MSDDLEKLAALLREEMPPPRAEAKMAALEAGMAAFEKNTESFQGTADSARPIHNRPQNGRGFLEGFMDMLNKLTPRGMMLGTASFATIALAIFITQNVDLNNGAVPPIPDMTTSEQGLADISGNDTEVVQRPAPIAAVTPPLNDAERALIAPADEIDGFAVTQENRAEAGGGAKMADAAPVAAEEMAATGQGIVGVLNMAQALTPSARTREGAVNAPLAAAPAGGLMSMETESDGYIEPLVENRDQFAGEAVSPVKVAIDEPVSTFSIDVDTASYAVMRRALLNGYLPAAASVRTEEMINYFNYNYATPATAEAPFAPQATVMPTPWNDNTLLMHIGIQGYDIPLTERPPVNLVFLLDTSGSMSDSDKLPLLIQSFRLLLSQLSEQDSVAIVTYAGSAGMALEPTPANETRKILASLTQLSAGGSTAGQAGLEQAYQLAEDMMQDGDTSRVILATDGDFNVGMSSVDAMQTYIEEKRESGVYLSILGFGQGNYNDALMQTLAQNGNGTASYIDTLAEAQKVLVDQIGGALFTIAQDVKIQVEFNPAEVAEYRLIGYETRALNREDFNNDAVDAGDIGAGTQVTALYEITPVGSPAISVDPLRYGEGEALPESNGELAFLKLRYKLPGESSSNLLTTPVLNQPVDQATQDVIFSTAVASFGQLLRDDTRLGDWSFDDVLALAQQGKGDDPFGYRAEFIRLVRLAETAQ